MLKRIRASFQSRVLIPWQTEHFEQTKHGKRLAALKGLHQGRRCFLVGNGPSLRAEDLTALHRAGELSFAFNRIYQIFDQTEWRPSYYISQDEKMLLGCAEQVDSLDLPTKLIPINLHWWYKVNIRNATWFLLEKPREKGFQPMDFSDRVDQRMYNATTCMYTAAQLAAFMGCTEIYLIGVDHQFSTSINNRGEILVDPTVKDYFSDSYNPDKDKLYIPNPEKSTFTYIAIKEQCQLRGIKVYNATRGGKLEVFPRVSLDSLLSSKEVTLS